MPDSGSLPQNNVDAETGIVVAADANELTAFDGMSGRQLWSRPFSTGVDTGLKGSRGGRLLIEANGQYALVDVRTGEQVWASGPSLPADRIQLFSSDTLLDGAETVVIENDGDVSVYFVGQEYPVGMYGGRLVFAT